MADVATSCPDDLTSEERIAFYEACPSARVLSFHFGLAPKGAVPGIAFEFGICVTFADGRRHGLRSRVSAGTAEDRAHLLRTAAVKLRDWYDGKAAS